jgi:hypothetical protein
MKKNIFQQESSAKAFGRDQPQPIQSDLDCPRNRFKRVGNIALKDMASKSEFEYFQVSDKDLENHHQVEIRKLADLRVDHFFDNGCENNRC